MLFQFGDDTATSYEELEAVTESAEQAKKLRRRQSDARWRANLASCYETLKLIIPVNARASKKQVSKAVILQETSKHINFLEELLFKALQEKGRMEGQDDVDGWCATHIKSIMNGFEPHHRQQYRRQRRRRRQPIFSDRRLLCGSRTRNQQIVEIENEEYSRNVDSSNDDIELMEALICSDDNGVWSELVSSSPASYEKGFAPEEIHQASFGFTPVKLPPTCYPVHLPSKFSPLHSVNSDKSRPVDVTQLEPAMTWTMDTVAAERDLEVSIFRAIVSINSLVDEEDFSVYHLDGSNSDHDTSDNFLNLLCDELMWQSSDDDNCSVARDKLESTPRCGKERHQQNDVTKPVKSFRMLKVTSHGTEVWSRAAPRCRRALDLSCDTSPQPSNRSDNQAYDCNGDAQPHVTVEESSASSDVWSEYETCHEGKDFIVLSHDLDTSTTEEPPEEIPHVGGRYNSHPATATISQNEVSYLDDYSVACEACSSPQSGSKYFVHEAAADLSLAPGLKFSKEEARNMSFAMNDCYDGARNNSSIPSGFSISTGDQKEVSTDDEYNGFVGQYSPLFDRLLFSL